MSQDPSSLSQLLWPDFSFLSPNSPLQIIFLQKVLYVWDDLEKKKKYMDVFHHTNVKLSKVL